MTEAYTNKRDCLDRAKALLKSGDSASIRHACLELRMCMEAITYEKLGAYKSRLPPGVLARWQPPQAVAALLDLEDEAGAEYKLAFGPTGGALSYIGEHRTFALPWLRKNYNKLGALLHVRNQNAPDSDAGTRNSQKTRAYLDEIVTECERVVESSVTATMSRIVEFNCQACGQKSVSNSASAERRGRVLCIHSKCQAEHIVTRKDEELFFRLSGASFRCQACSGEMFVPSKALAVDHEFACGECGRRHKLVDQVWRFVAEIERSDAAS